MPTRSVKTFIIASALSVLALSTSPVIGTLAPNFSASTQAVAQEAVLPIIVNETQFKDLVGKGAIIVDSRQPAAYERGHIPGAVNLPWPKLNVSERDGIRNEFAEDSVFEEVISAAGLKAGDTLVICERNE